MTSSSVDLRSKFSEIQEKYGVRNKDGSFAGGWSIAKMFADGKLSNTRVHRLVASISPKADSPLPPPPPEDRTKLSGILTLADLNQHRSESGEGGTLSESDVKVITDRTEEDFSTYKTDPEMNLRRNRYLMFTAEVFRPGTQK